MFSVAAFILDQGPEVTDDVVRSTYEKIQIVFLGHEAISQAGTGRLSNKMMC